MSFISIISVLTLRKKTYKKLRKTVFGETGLRLLKLCLFVESSKEYEQKSQSILLVDFSRTFDSRNKVKMEQIPVVYSLLKETVTVIMML